MSIEAWIVVFQVAVFACLSADAVVTVVYGRGQTRRQGELLENDKRIFERLRKLEGESQASSERKRDMEA